ncbi:MAG TPA: hypothetical protein VF521_01100 [Pyrinomonadaceae bacterium]
MRRREDTYQVTVPSSAWSLLEAIGFIIKHTDLFRHYGFIACLYGSVLKADPSAAPPKDLDIMAVAHRPGARALDCAEALCNVTGGRLADHATGVMGAALSYAIELRDGRVVDVQFRDHARRCPACGRAEL